MNFTEPSFIRRERKPTTFAPAAELERNYLQLKDGILASILDGRYSGVLLMENTPWKGGERRLAGGPFLSGLGAMSLADTGCIGTSLGFLIAELKGVTGIL